ncbi:hypothetical protein FRC12_021035 [Ceratobasidium sp. 428]|nr:hypothetical protein FRC12_021035 [Ceratobasidium sp. 428]
MPFLPRATPGSNALEMKGISESPEEMAVRRNRPRLGTDEPVQIPIAHRHLISKAREMLNYVASWESRRESGPLIERTSELKYGVDDLTDLLSEMHELGVDAPETVQLGSLCRRACDFQHKTRCLLLEHDLHRDRDDTASLARIKKLVAIGRGLWLRLGELAKLELLVTRLEVSRDLRTINLNGLTLDQAEKLILRGQGVGVSPNDQAMIELARKVTAGLTWKAYATSVLAQPRPDMKDIYQLLASVHSMPTIPDILDKVNQVWLRGYEFEQQVGACLRPPREKPVSIDYANQLAIAVLGEVYFPEAEELRAFSTEAQILEERCEKIMAGRFEAGENATVFDEIRMMEKKDMANLWPFQMPRFQQMVLQLAAHDDWISRLPWTRLGLSALELESIVRDLTGDGDTECVSPTSEVCTCICFDPVAIGESGQDADVAQCDHCLVKFHAKCIEGSCPFCDDQTWNKLMGEPQTFKRQHMRSQYETACTLTRHYSFEYHALKAILFDSGDSALSKRIIRFIEQLTRQESPDLAAVPQIRHFMRKLYRIQFEISTRPEIFAYGLSLAYLHRQMTMRPQTKQMARQKPKFVFKAELHPHSRCLCSGTRGNWPDRLCSKCRSSYHGECVALSNVNQASEPFVCPLCLLKEGKNYGPAEVRVKYHDDDPEENAKFVDVKECLDNYSWRAIRCAFPPSVRKTITAELFLFIPGTKPNVEEPDTHPESYSEVSVESASRQSANESSDGNDASGSRASPASRWMRKFGRLMGVRLHARNNPGKQLFGATELSESV